MADKARNFFRKPNGGNFFPALLAFGGFAGGCYYLYHQKEKSKSKVTPQPVESKLTAAAPAKSEKSETAAAVEKKPTDASESYLRSQWAIIDQTYASILSSFWQTNIVQ